MHTATSRRYYVRGGRRQNKENYRHVAIILRARKAVRTSVIVPVHAHIIQPVVLLVASDHWQLPDLHTGSIQHPRLASLTMPSGLTCLPSWNDFIKCASTPSPNPILAPPSTNSGRGALLRNSAGTIRPASVAPITE